MNMASNREDSGARQAGNMEIQLKKRMRTVAAGLALACGAGVAMAQYAGPSMTTESPAASAPPSALRLLQSETKIVPGDLLAIATYGVPELTITDSSGVSGGLRVSTQGTVILPYLGTVKLGGMTATEASNFLAKELKQDGILVNPQVTVQILNSPTQMVTVVGEVMRPQPVPVYGAQLRLLDVISACGGFTPLASHSVTIHRLGEPKSITVNLGVDPRTTDAINIPLMAGDTVVVPRVGNAYIVGEVRSPAAIPLSGNAPITVVQAITMTGGLKYGAALSKAMIIRTTTDRQRVEILFDLKKVMDGKEQDIALMSNDIVYVPKNGFKAAISTGNAAQTAVYAAAEIGYLVP
jgi:polysaccharide export outer membrane protein